ncbi:MAG: sensor histidine kinase [Candidatus Sericytochromatia bacterium]
MGNTPVLTEALLLQDTEPKRILLIEDHSVDAFFLAETLDQIDTFCFELIWKNTLTEGLNYLHQERCEIILLDLSLTDSQGLDTLNSVIEAASHLPVVVLTGQEDEGIGIRAMQLGAQDYLPKSALEKGLLMRTIHHAIERKQLQSQLEFMRKLDSLHQFSKILAKDLENSLRLMSAHNRLAKQQVAADSKVHYYLTQMDHVLDYQRSLLSHLHSYSDKPQQTQRLNLGNLVEKVLERLSPHYPAAGRIRCVLERESAWVDGEQGHLSELIQQLVLNALEAVGEKDSLIQIQAGTIYAETDYLCACFAQKKLSEGPYIYLEVCDAGCGMDGPTLQKIFDPFFTTKERGRGLGLSNLLRILFQHQGAIHLASQENKGTCVGILFPCRLRLNAEQDFKWLKRTRL